MFSAKNLAIITGIALCTIILFNTDAQIGGKPENVHDCDAAA